MIGIASCVASFLAGIAYADGFGTAAASPAATEVAPIADVCVLEPMPEVVKVSP
jgi:hypothetical protein